LEDSASKLQFIRGQLLIVQHGKLYIVTFYVFVAFHLHMFVTFVELLVRMVQRVVGLFVLVAKQAIEQDTSSLGVVWYGDFSEENV